MVSSLVAEHRLWGAWVAVTVTPGLQRTGSIIVYTGLVVPWHVGSSWIGIEPVPSALAGGFFTSEPPGKPPKSSYMCHICLLKRGYYLQAFFGCCFGPLLLGQTILL